MRGNDSIVLNINALAAAFLVKLWKETQDDVYLIFARKLLTFTVRRRTSYDAWYYTFPREKSPITHDNYHTGGILDALLEFYETTGDDRYLEVYWKGLQFYKARLFEEDGAPRWMHDKKYPFDIHGAAQGIITFTKASEHRDVYFQDATKTLSWTIANLYRPRTQDFSYRQGRYIMWHYTLMRWCNAWMTRALSEFYRFSSERNTTLENDGS
jgi:rhamnogalacturonyl hydrolase YesR